MEHEVIVKYKAEREIAEKEINAALQKFNEKYGFVDMTIRVNRINITDSSSPLENYIYSSSIEVML